MTVENHLSKIILNGGGKILNNPSQCQVYVFVVKGDGVGRCANSGAHCYDVIGACEVRATVQYGRRHQESVRDGHRHCSISIGATGLFDEVRLAIDMFTYITPRLVIINRANGANTSRELLSTDPPIKIRLNVHAK